MTELKFAVTISANLEVHDKDGNLLNTQPVDHTVEMTTAEIARFLGEPDGDRL